MPAFVDHLAFRGLTAMAEACFPECDSDAPDHRDTELVERTREYLQLLPTEQQRLLTALFVAVELGGPLLLRQPRRFSALPVAARTAAINRWRGSSFAPHRMLGDAIKGLMTMMYMSHPAVLQHIGEFRVCGHPGDATGIPTREEELAGHQSLGGLAKGQS